MAEIRDLKDIKYGLMVVDPETLDEVTDTLDIVHFGILQALTAKLGIGTNQQRKMLFH